jgi:hypothetical protein
MSGNRALPSCSCISLRETALGARALNVDFIVYNLRTNECFETKELLMSNWMKLGLPAMLATALLLVGLPASGHHSAVAFDKSESKTITGTVTKFVWRNPHLSISMDVDNNGSNEAWRIEGGSTTEMVNGGFTRDSIVVGQEISVLVNPLRSGKPGGLLQGMTLADGTAFGMEYPDAPTTVVSERQLPSLTAYVPPPADETWQKREAKTRPPVLPLPPENPILPLGALDAENLAKPRPKPGFDITGTWAFRGEREVQANYGTYEFKPHPKWTTKGQGIYDEYQSFAQKGERYAEPTAWCYPAGMPRLMTRYGSLMMLQYPTAIFILSRLNNEYRVVFLDGRERQADNLRDPNWNGESLGRWEGDTLVIESEGFTDENHLIQQGVFTGDQLKITERISIINDGNTMKMDFIMTDPEHWVGEWRHTKFRDRMLSGDVKEASCLSEDNLSLPGMGN